MDSHSTHAPDAVDTDTVLDDTPPSDAAGRGMTSLPAVLDPLLTIEEVSEYLRTPVKTLYDWRYKHVGPKAMLIGRALRYRASDLNAWLDQQAS
jgi:excisionase family DNA binding protein